jgi:hypothetical protein
MAIVFTAIAVGIATGTLTGSLLALALLRKGSRTSRPHEGPIDQITDRRIRDASTGWAAAQGRPDAAGLVAKKLRMLHITGRRRANRRWR